METQTRTEPEITTRGRSVQTITTILSFDNQAEEAVNLYTSIFKNSKTNFITRYSEDSAQASNLPKGSVMTISFQIEGQDFVAMNGGNYFKFTPAVSLLVNCDTQQEIDELWKRLSDRGTVLMKLDKYPFSDRYGWIQDRFGLSWQLYLGTSTQKISPYLMFCGEQQGRAEEAMNFYITVFKNSAINRIVRYEDQEPKGKVMHAVFTLNSQEFMAMDSGVDQNYTFAPGVSFVVNCENQEEIDFYWNKLTQGGDEKSQMCGWLQDRFGLSWQIVPNNLGELLSGPDASKSKRVMKALMEMKKLDIKKLTEA